MTTVKVYGADWCGDTQSTRRQLDSLGVDYQYINVEENEEASEWVKRQNGGRELKPTVSIGQTILSVPDEAELNSALEKAKLVS